MPELTVMSPSRLRSRTRKLSSVTGYYSDTMKNFWGIELTEASPEAEWNMREEEDGSDRDYMINTLMLKMATLGAGRNKSEEHVVEIETRDMDEKTINIPIVNMAAGINMTMNLDYELNDKNKVTFRLLTGQGPIYLSGIVVRDFPDDDTNSQEDSMYTETETTATDENDEDESEDGEEEDEDEEEEEEDEEVEIKGKGTKRKVSSILKNSKSKRGKVEKEESDEEDSEEDEDEEEDMDIGGKKKKRPSVSPRGKSPRVKPAAKSPANKDKKKSKKAKAK